ncbi:MAG: MarR family winged helix-turn-helix transcriptional regulator [Mycoplasmatales bacterium]
MDLKKEINDSCIQIFDFVLQEEYSNLKNMGLKELTLNELHLLVKIKELKKLKAEVNPKDLTEQLNITKGTLSIYTTKLINKNYIERKFDLGDRRKINLILKPKAEYAIKLHDEWHEKFINIALQGLNNKEQEKVNIVLKNILNNLNK